MHLRFGLIVALLAVITPLTASAQHLFSPRQAIEAAADTAPAPVSGLFDIQVRSTGHDAQGVYLNSEADYHDQRNLTVAIPPELVARLTRQYGEPLEIFFRHKHLIVSGQAKRVSILLSANGRPTDKYYFQTHVDITDPNQLRVFAETPSATPSSSN